MAVPAGEDSAIAFWRCTIGVLAANMGVGRDSSPLASNPRLMHNAGVFSTLNVPELFVTDTWAKANQTFEVELPTAMSFVKSQHAASISEID